MQTDNNNLYNLMMDFYLIFSKFFRIFMVLYSFDYSEFSTMAMQSCGPVSDMYRDMLGVYRVVGHRVYKQEGGENYIYYR